MCTRKSLQEVESNWNSAFLIVPEGTIVSRIYIKCCGAKECFVVGSRFKTEETERMLIPCDQGGARTG